MAHIVLSEDGFPVLLADVPNAGTSTVDPNAKSGNPRHDTASGKFGSGGGQKKGPSQAQANIDPQELAVRNDAVRDAARQYDLMTGADAEEFLAKRAKNLDAVDIQQFLLMVRGQRLDDIADILAGEIGSAKKGNVRLAAKRGYAKKVLQGLSDEEIVSMAGRLRRRGISEAKIRSGFISRISDPERREALEDQLSKASEDAG